jgi:hypothetical protein
MFTFRKNPRELGHGSSGRAPALQAQSPNPEHTHTKKKENPRV